MLALENRYIERNTHKLWLVTMGTKISKVKRLTFPDPHKPVIAKKNCVW